MLPASFALSRKKSLTTTSSSIFNENSQISIVTSISPSRIAVVINSTKIKVVDVIEDKLVASVVAHSERITSMNLLKNAIIKLENNKQTATRIKPITKQKRKSSSAFDEKSLEKHSSTEEDNPK